MACHLHWLHRQHQQCSFHELSSTHSEGIAAQVIHAPPVSNPNELTGSPRLDLSGIISWPVIVLCTWSE